MVLLQCSRTKIIDPTQRIVLIIKATTFIILITITNITFIIISSEGGPYCELGLPGGADMHTLSMDDFQVIIKIAISMICNTIIVIADVQDF